LPATFRPATRRRSSPRPVNLTGEQVPGDYQGVKFEGSYGPAWLIQIRLHPVWICLRDGQLREKLAAESGGFREHSRTAYQGLRQIPDNWQNYTALITTVVDETSLMLEASATGRLAGRCVVSIAELDGMDWIASPSSSAESLMGVWPGPAGRPRVAHTARDWLTKLQLVAADCGITTVPPHLACVRPAGVQPMGVEDARPEHRRALVARLPGRVSESVAAVFEVIRAQFSR